MYVNLHTRIEKLKSLGVLMFAEALWSYCSFHDIILISKLNGQYTMV